MFQFKNGKTETPLDDGEAELDDQSLLHGHSDLTDVIVLSRLVEHVELELDTHYREILVNRTEISTLNPYFLITWHNMFECMFAWIEDFAKVGVALRNIRDVEIVS